MDTRDDIESVCCHLGGLLYLFSKYGRGLSDPGIEFRHPGNIRCDTLSDWLDTGLGEPRHGLDHRIPCHRLAGPDFDTLDILE